MDKPTCTNVSDITRFQVVIKQQVHSSVYVYLLFDYNLHLSHKPPPPSTVYAKASIKMEGRVYLAR